MQPKQLYLNHLSDTNYYYQNIDAIHCEQLPIYNDKKEN